MAIYDDQMEVAFAGMKVDSGDDRVETFAAGGPVPFGAIVVTPTATPDGAAFVPSGGGATPQARGCALHSHTIPQEGYVLYDAMSVMTKGLAWVRAAAATAIARNTQLQYNTAGLAVAAAGTVFERAVTRGPVVTLADGTFVLPVEFDSPMDADAV